MFPAGYARFNYHCKKFGDLGRINTDEIVCDRGNLEATFGENLLERGLELPDGNLSVEIEKGEITIIRSLALSENGPSIFYKRLYLPQQEFKELITGIDRTLEKAYSCQWDDTSLSMSKLFEKYLVENLSFTEKATVRPYPFGKLA